jgi:hypothetical protein
MSIEWLLTKAPDTETQKKALERTQEEGELSDKVHDSKPKEPNRTAENGQPEGQPKDIHASSAETQGRASEIDLRCDCGYEGTVALGEMDSKLTGKDEKGTVFFDCPDCGRHLQYDYSTGKIKAKKGVLGALLGRFS